MDTRNSTLVAGLYLLCGLGVAAVGYFYYASQRESQWAAIESERAREAQLIAESRIRPTLRPATANSGTVRELHDALIATRAQLDQTAQTLRQKNSECSLLREKLDYTVDVLVNVLGDVPNAADPAVPAPREAFETGLAELQQSLQTPAAGGETAAPPELQRLQFEIEQLTARLAMVEADAQRELELALFQKRAVVGAANQTIVGCGLLAVPLVMEQLEDERVEVRRWAAEVLGAVGSDAREAIPAVRRLTSDPDPTVRSAATVALRKLEE